MKDEEKRKKENTASDLTQLKAPGGDNWDPSFWQEFRVPALG